MADDKPLTESEREELERLRKQKSGELSLKVSKKGAVSLYGLGRYPVSLYKEQWERVFPFVPEMEKFIADNADKLKTKD